MSKHRFKVVLFKVTHDRRDWWIQAVQDYMVTGAISERLEYPNIRDYIDAAMGCAPFDIEIGAHTVDHPILASVADEVAESQIRASREQLEAMIGAPVKSFAYPNGKPHRDYLARHVGMARAAGFDLALATAWGAATAESDPFQIPRVAAWDSDALRYGLRLARAYRDRQPVLA